MAGCDLVPFPCGCLVTCPFGLMPDTFVRSSDEITQSTLVDFASCLELLLEGFFFTFVPLCRFFHGRMQTGFPLFNDATK